MSQRSERRGEVRAVGCLVLLVATVALAAPTTPPSLGTSKIVDLSHAFDEKTLYWPTSPSSFELKKLSFGDTPGGWFYAANSLCTPEHGGTHLDAPIHFSKDGKTIDQIPPATAHRAGGAHRRHRESERGPRLPPGDGRRPELGEATREHPAGCDRPAANRLGEALAGPEAVPG